jgi:hypothetical protein
MPSRRRDGDRRRRGRSGSTCPNCGADVPAGSTACPSCGADEDTGWAEGADMGAADVPTGYASDDDFDYDEFMREEFPDEAPAPAARWTLRRVLLVAALVAMLIFFFVLTVGNR